MLLGFDRGVIAGIGLLVVMIVGIAATSYVNTRNLRDNAARATQSRELLEVINAIRMETRKAQAAQRAFVISGVDSRLIPYHEAAATIRAKSTELSAMTKDDPEQYSLAEKVAKQTEEGIAGMNMVIAILRVKGFDAVVALAKDKELRSFVDPLLETLGEMDSHERERLMKREAEARQAYDRSVVYEFTAAGLGLLTVAIFVLLLDRSGRTRIKVANRLAEQRELLDATLLSIGDAVITTDSQGNVTFLNIVAESLTGWKSAEAKGVPLDRVFHIYNESTRIRVENPASRAQAQKKAATAGHHTILIAKDGTERPIDDAVAPIRSGGTVGGTVLVFRDISERKRHEVERERLLKEVQAAKDRLDEVFRRAPSFMCVFRGPDHVFELVNERYLQLVGHRSVLGKTVREALPEVAGQGYFELLDQVYRTGNSFVGTEMRVVLQQKVGQPPAERYLDFVYMPVRNADGAVSGVLLHGIDLTDRKEAGDKLVKVIAESERQRRMFDTALANTPDFVYLFDLDGRFTFINKSLLDLWQKDFSQAVGKNFHELGYPPDLANLLDRQIQTVIQTHQTVRDETPFTTAAGERIYEYIFVPVIGAEGAVEAVAGSTRDITDRKQVEESIRDADRKKDDFIALLAHELRNPLAPIRHGLEMLRLSQDHATRAKATEMMNRQLVHMVRMIDDLLDVSRIGRNKMELRRARVTLADVVGSAVEMAQPLIDEAGHRLDIYLPRQTIYLEADLTRLAQVLSNLLTNSAKYMERGGHIRLSAERQDQNVAVSVRDAGIGIPAASLPTIFDMFSQVDRPIERRAGGLGIGLALVKGLVEMHGGTVSVHSDRPGQGSTFTITLPALPEETSAITPAHVETPLASLNRRRRILVVDDSRDGADSLAMMLTLGGNEVVTAYNGLEAVAQAEKFQPEIILMDVGMPLLNGLEATRRIRAQTFGKGIRIIALTGWGQENDKERSRQAGCDGHLVKPVHLPDLQKILED